jgi:hypothetical protein
MRGSFAGERQGGAMETEDPLDGDELEAEIMQANRPFAVDRRGTTAEEAVEGEGLEEALDQERPEGPTTDEALGLEDDGVPDEEDELVAEGSIEMDEFASPEESALSVRDEAPGATDHEDPHPDEVEDLGSEE